MRAQEANPMPCHAIFGRVTFGNLAWSGRVAPTARNVRCGAWQGETE